MKSRSHAGEVATAVAIIPSASKSALQDRYFRRANRHFQRLAKHAGNRKANRDKERLWPHNMRADRST